MTAEPARGQAAHEAGPGPGAADVTHSAARWWALVAIAASVLVVGLDLTVLNLALPSIATSLHASTSDLQWISDSYSLVLAALILPAGLLGDRFGRKKLLLGALVLFGGASLWCAYSGATGELIAARAVLGIGAAAIFPLSLSVIPVLFAPAERTRAIGAIAGASVLSFPIGPILGGFMLTHLWWGSVFLINVPVVVLAVIAVVTLLPESRSATRPRLDVAGIAVSGAGLVALTYGFIKAGQDGWSDPAAVGLIAAGAVVLALLYFMERGIARRGGQPLADVGLFRLPGFRWGTILATLLSFAMFGLFFTLPQYFQDVRGASPLGSGLRLLPMIVGMVGGMVAGNRLKMPRIAITAGYLTLAAGMVLGALTTLGSSTGYMIAWVALAGVGVGLVMPNAMSAALGDLSAERSGAGSALLTALRQVGTTVGVAVLGTVISTSYTSRLAGTTAGLPSSLAAAVRSSVGAGVAAAQHAGSASLLNEIRTAFVTGMDVMLWICCGIAAGCALLAAVVLKPRRAAGPADGPGELTEALSAGAAGAAGAAGEGAQSAP